MKTSERITTDKKNMIDGRIMHYRLSAAAEKEKGVIISGTLHHTHYQFTDSSGIAVDHKVGDFKIW